MQTEKSKVSVADRVKLARHPERPYTMDILEDVFTDFVEVHGDRRFADDRAMVCGFARLDGQEVMVIGQQKGRDLEQRRYRNFGMAKPEGYRKALRVMKMAEKFSRPLITFVDTPGAYPGIDAEERGQAEAIALNLREMAKLKIPTIIVILGEGGSGGALAIGIGDRVLMMENAIYSVITPEGCAAILWKDAGESERAAKSLKLTASDLEKLKIIDGVIPEASEWRKIPEVPLDDVVTKGLKSQLLIHLKDISEMDVEKRLEERYEKFRNMGEWVISDKSQNDPR